MILADCQRTRAGWQGNNKLRGSSRLVLGTDRPEVSLVEPWSGDSIQEAGRGRAQTAAQRTSARSGKPFSIGSSEVFQHGLVERLPSVGVPSATTGRKSTPPTTWSPSSAISARTIPATSFLGFAGLPTWRSRDTNGARQDNRAGPSDSSAARLATCVKPDPAVVRSTL